MAGELYVDRTSLKPDEMLALGSLEWRSPRGEKRPLRLKAVRATHDKLLVTFAGIPNREAAAGLTNGALWGDAAKLPDPGPGVAYTFQLVGLRVVDAGGAEIGVLQDITFNAGQPLYVVKTPAREMLVPGLPPFVTRVDMAAGTIEMALPPGFEEL